MDTAIKILYWAEQISDSQLYEPKGIEDFKHELGLHYNSVVHGRPGDLGGINQFIIDVTSNLTLEEVVKFIASGVAYDLIKAGTKSFILRPFLEAYKKLKERNPDYGLDIESFQIAFEDSIVYINQITADSIFNSFEKIFQQLTKHYEKLKRPNGERPFEIYIPVFPEPETDRTIKYRQLLDVDETIEKVSSSDYFNYWGLSYDFARIRRVYDLTREILLEEEFNTVQMYWQEGNL